MSNLICTPTLKCPFCSNESLALFRSKISLQLDIVEAGENKQCGSVTALLCDENHFFSSGAATYASDRRTDRKPSLLVPMWKAGSATGNRTRV